MSSETRRPFDTPAGSARSRAPSELSLPIRIQAPLFHDEKYVIPIIAAVVKTLYDPAGKTRWQNTPAKLPTDFISLVKGYRRRWKRYVEHQWIGSFYSHEGN
jgi:hypothetical protein